MATAWPAMSGAVLFLIPARGGSRRLPGKNLRTVGGIPLVGRAARVGRAAAAAIPGGPHRVVCSTDDDGIASAAAAWGAEVLGRPARLATDEATSVDVALHALDALEAVAPSFETLVLLQPTAPLTEPDDVVAAVARHRATTDRAPAGMGRGAGPAERQGVTSVVASHPAAWHHVAAADGSLRPVATATAAVLLAGAFYVVTPGALRRTRTFIDPGRTLGLPVPEDRGVDVDDELDLLAAEAILAARPARPFPVAGRVIGTGPAFVIAEGGVNHNGDLELARRIVDAAADVGADAVKFQTFDPSALAAAGAPTADYQRRAGVEAADQREMLASLTLPREAWAELQARARDRGLVFLSTPFDDPSADLLDALGVPAFKVGSGELTNTPFIARLARRGRPVLISTGMADMVEVADAVDTVQANGDVPLALFHCVSSYPAAPADANLRAIETMRRAFGVPVGWSDHTPGSELALAAIGLGASIVEKHLTLDRSLPGPDHQASLEPDAFADMVRGIRATEAAIGNGVKLPVVAERDVAAVARRSLHWASSLSAGARIGEADVAILRPGTGLPPSRLSALVGRRTARAVVAGNCVDPADIGAGT